MLNTDFQQDVARTLLYYEIFSYPLSAKELFALFPKNSITFEQFKAKLSELVHDQTLIESLGYYYLPKVESDFSLIRSQREHTAQSKLKLARVFTSIIKQFPFVRGVFLSGELSKHVATPDSDIDYVIVTAPNRLWITRFILIAFKKTFLFNKKNFFCLNYFVSENRMQINENSYYIATEVAHLKPLYNFPLFLRYINSNHWIKDYFPNYSVFLLTNEPRFESRGIFQSIIEFFVRGTWLDSLDVYLMNKMNSIWKTRYKEFDNETHKRLFLCSREESRAFVGNFAERIETKYYEKLKLHNLL